MVHEQPKGCTPAMEFRELNESLLIGLFKWLKTLA